MHERNSGQSNEDGVIAVISFGSSESEISGLLCSTGVVLAMY